MSTKELKRRQKIQRALIENYKGVRHVEVSAKETHLFLIGGKNTHGKSSVLDALRTAISGKKYAVNPVRKGEKSALIQVELDDLKIDLNIHTDGKVEPVMFDLATGKKVKKPKTVLRELFGEYAMDPSGILRMSKAERREALKNVLVDEDGKPVLFNDLDEKYDKLYQQRRDEKKELKRAEARLQEHPEVDGAPKDELKSTELVKQLEEANDHNQKIARLKNQHESRVREETAAQKEVDRLEAELKRAKAHLKKCEGESKRALESVNEAGEEKSTDAIEDELRKIEDTNAKFRAQQAHLKAREEFTSQQDLVAKIEREMDEIKEERANRIKTGRFAIDGVSFDDDDIVYNGVSFDDCSQAERYRIGFHLALAGKPQMPVCFIDNGELLDDEAVKVFDDEAKNIDAQVFMAAGSRLERYDLFLENGEAADHA